MKTRLITLCLILLCASGCDGGAEKDNAPVGAAQTGETRVDIDLTALNSTLVYAQVSDMLNNPLNYLGKTVKMNGPYFPLYYKALNRSYHYVIIEDAAACCQGGMEFILNSSGDYPEDGDRIEIAGVFKSYEEYGTEVYYLAVDSISLE